MKRKIDEIIGLLNRISYRERRGLPSPDNQTIWNPFFYNLQTSILIYLAEFQQNQSTMCTVKIFRGGGTGVVDGEGVTVKDA